MVAILENELAYAKMFVRISFCISCFLKPDKLETNWSVFLKYPFVLSVRPIIPLYVGSPIHDFCSLVGSICMASNAISYRICQRLPS